VASPSVITVGAGLASLIAARALQQRGCPGAVLAAREQVGGRVGTLCDGFCSIVGEAGGEFSDADRIDLNSAGGMFITFALFDLPAGNPIR
jgi:monoamine oxidase